MSRCFKPIPRNAPRDFHWNRFLCLELSWLTVWTSNPNLTFPQNRWSLQLVTCRHGFVMLYAPTTILYFTIGGRQIPLSKPFSNRPQKPTHKRWQDISLSDHKKNLISTKVASFKAQNNVTSSLLPPHRINKFGDLEQQKFQKSNWRSKLDNGLPKSTQTKFMVLTVESVYFQQLLVIRDQQDHIFRNRYPQKNREKNSTQRSLSDINEQSRHNLQSTASGEKKYVTILWASSM